MARERVGIVGWNYPEWRGTVYPPGMKPPEFLREYAKFFPIVEVASSFYKAPDAEHVAAWAAAVPSGFELSLKLPEWMTKKPAEPEVADGLSRFVDRLAPLAKEEKLGSILAQFPGFFRRERRAGDLAAFVGALPKGPHWAIELRHASWWHEETYKLLSDANVTLVWSALESGRTPPVVTSDRLYLRLFLDRELQPPYGTKRRDRSDEIRYWADRVRDEGASAAQVDIFMSKFLEGFAPGSAATMCGMLGLPVPDVVSEKKKLDAAPAPAKEQKGPRQMTFDM